MLTLPAWLKAARAVGQQAHPWHPWLQSLWSVPFLVSLRTEQALGSTDVLPQHVESGFAWSQGAGGWAGCCRNTGEPWLGGMCVATTECLVFTCHSLLQPSTSG